MNSGPSIKKSLCKGTVAGEHSDPRHQTNTGMARGQGGKGHAGWLGLDSRQDPIYCVVSRGLGSIPHLYQGIRAAPVL